MSDIYYLINSPQWPHTTIKKIIFWVLRSPAHCAMVNGIELNVKHRGLIAAAEKVALIKKLIEQNPDISRWALSKKL